MRIPIGRTFTASVSGVAVRGVNCENCQHRFAYPIGRTVVGQGFSFLFLDDDGANERAVQSAHLSLEKKLRNEVEVYRCPECGFYDPSMFRLIQSRFWIWIAVIAVVAFLTGIAAVIAGIMQVGARHEWLPAWSVLGGIAGTLVCAMLVMLKMLLTDQIDPNEERYQSMLKEKYLDGFSPQPCRERIQVAESKYVSTIRKEKNVISAGVVSPKSLDKLMRILKQPAEEVTSSSKARSASPREDSQERSEPFAECRQAAGTAKQSDAGFDPTGIWDASADGSSEIEFRTTRRLGGIFLGFGIFLLILLTVAFFSPLAKPANHDGDKVFLVVAILVAIVATVAGSILLANRNVQIGISAEGVYVAQYRETIPWNAIRKAEVVDFNQRKTMGDRVAEGSIKVALGNRYRNRHPPMLVISFNRRGQKLFEDQDFVGSLTRKSLHVRDDESMLVRLMWIDWRSDSISLRGPEDLANLIQKTVDALEANSKPREKP